MSLMKEYMKQIEFYSHNDEKWKTGQEKMTPEERVCSVKLLDFHLRELIGKTEDIRVPMCSHHAIIQRELGEGFCRVCHKDLRIAGIGRWNDYLILRHPSCQSPICYDCAKDKPDQFHIAFKKGLEKYHYFRDIDKQIAGLI